MSSSVSDRFREVRYDLYGEHGAPMLAAEIGVPTRLLLGCEEGQPLRDVALLRFLAVTGVEAGWLLKGVGPKYQRRPPSA